MKEKAAYRVDVPLLDVFVNDAFNQINVPPKLGVVLQGRMIKCDTSPGIDAQGLAGAFQFACP